MKIKFKTLMSLTLVFLLGVSATIPVRAHEIDEMQQLDRLLELQSIVELYNKHGVTPLNIEDFPEYMPIISLISAPAYTLDGTFSIGLRIDTGILGYEDRHSDEMMEIFNSIIPTETINFILNFTDIPHEDANIFYTAYFDVPMYFPENVEYYMNIDPYINLNATMRMGDRIFFSAMQGQTTAGHPVNSLGSSFFTSIHRTGVNGTNVFSLPLGSPSRIGTIMRSVFNNRVDIAQVDVTVSNSRMSPQLPWGGNIQNFRGVPGNNQSVRTISGFSGVMNGVIRNANASVGDVQNKVLVSPDLGQGGDSGSALIRVNDSAVLGTKRGAIMYQGAWHMVFTNVQNY